MTELIRFSQNNATPPAPLALTIGNFDGVHRGHQALVEQLCFQAKQRQLPTAVLLFEPQPVEFFSRDKAPARLCRLGDKVLLLRELGVDYVFCMRFNQSLANTSAYDFAHEILFKQLHAQYLLLGADFHFGHQRYGDVLKLQAWSEAAGVEFKVVDDVCSDKQRISSTAIRQALAEGDLSRAEMLLGRPWFLSGRVGHGAGRGRMFGFPTANIHLQQQRLPTSGVFCVHLVVNQRRYPAVANLGCRPTVDGTRIVLEVHVLDFEQDLYRQRVQVNFLHKLRNEVKFNSIDELVQHIHQDVEQARQYFKSI